MLTRKELGALSDILDQAADNVLIVLTGQLSFEIAAELWSLAIDAANASNAHVTDDNKWIWHGVYHWPSWYTRSSMHFVLDCACGKSFSDMFEKDAIRAYFQHLREIGQ